MWLNSNIHNVKQFKFWYVGKFVLQLLTLFNVHWLKLFTYERICYEVVLQFYFKTFSNFQNCFIRLICNHMLLFIVVLCCHDKQRDNSEDWILTQSVHFHFMHHSHTTAVQYAPLFLYRFDCNVWALNTAYFLTQIHNWQMISLNRTATRTHPGSNS